MRTFVSLSLLAATLAVPVVANASITSLNDNFSATTVQLGRTGVIDSSFSTGTRAGVATNVDVLGPGNFGSLCTPTGVNCIDLGGTASGTGYTTDPNNGDPQGILQSTQMFAAGSYFLTFNLTGPGRGATAGTQVTFGNYSATFNLFDTAGNTGPSNQFVVLTTPGFLTFTDITPGNQGDILNSVTVTNASPATAGTPEPASITLLGSALFAGAGLLAMRRKQGLSL